MEVDFEVQVWSVGIARLPHHTDDVAGLDPLSNVDGRAAEHVAVAGEVWSGL
ncbi:hypothetical protein GCM10022220_60700 [Actinocatenispora rupis]|uniref:Uncharacterized protein n=1 Tax=Actinocatenispora rupis TaxID=519421 RepID=A0A8J3NFV9_9ACTN|nr:hypothetical protein Aru02nite_61940 [Actinocatenispora rupis]